MRKNSSLFPIAFILTALLGINAPSKSRGRPAGPSTAHEIANHPAPPQVGDAIALQGTALLSHPVSADLSVEQRQQIIHYFLVQIAATPGKRDSIWRPDFTSATSYQASVGVHRDHLRSMLGLVATHLGTPHIEVLSDAPNQRVEDVTLPTDSGLSARALIFVPQTASPAGAIIAIPPATESREEFAGVMEGDKPAEWLLTLLARNLVVAVPITIERRDDHPICRGAGGKDRRRVLWRAGYIVGRTMVGLEVQQALDLREYLSAKPELAQKPIAIMGRGDGGMTALFAAAIDEHFAAAAILDYFQQRENCWQEPVDRTLHGRLNEFGDAELAALIAPRPLLIGATAESSIPLAGVDSEFGRAERFYKGLKAEDRLINLSQEQTNLQAAALKIAVALGAITEIRAPRLDLQIPYATIEQARDQQFESWFHYLQTLISASKRNRDRHWQLESTPVADRAKKAAKLRAELADLVGVIHPEGPMNPRTRLVAETDKFLAYDVFLGVLPGVEAYGQLLVPRDVAGHVAERLPAVICQHGFNGEPQYVSGVGDDLESNDHFYHRFGQRLAERGYVVFAPYLAVPEVQHTDFMVHRADLINPMVGMSEALGMMRTGIELAKLHRIVDFLQSLPFVDPDHLGYYGLSYGGYSALWMPPLETRLKLTIISAHFNDWQTMLTDSSRQGASYWTLPDEDFYNWNVLNRFVHTQIIAAMWPRPVCIEYGSEDQVTTGDWHERAWQEVNAFAQAWGMQDNIVDDKFLGPHSIHGIGTFFFLDRWLRPDRPAGRDYGCRDESYCYENLAPNFHGYVTASSAPYTTQLLDSSPSSVIRGRFYVPAKSPIFTGMEFKLARIGNPGKLIVRFGSKQGANDLGEAEVLTQDVYPHYDLWYSAILKKAMRLDPGKLYYFELQAESGKAPEDAYTVFGPQPLGGEDFPSAFGLSFRTLTQSQ